MKLPDWTMGYFASILITLFLLSFINTNVNVLTLSPWEICSHLFVPEEREFRNWNSDVVFVSNSFSCSVSTHSVSYLLFFRVREDHLFIRQTCRNLWCVGYLVGYWEYREINRKQSKPLNAWWGDRHTGNTDRTTSAIAENVRCSCTEEGH